MKQQTQSRPHIKTFRLESKVIAEILKRGEPMTCVEFLSLEPCEVLSTETWSVRREQLKREGQEVPVVLWELILPKYVLASGYTCTPNWFTYEWSEEKGTEWIPNWQCIPVHDLFD